MVSQLTVEAANAYIEAEKGKVNPLYRPEFHFVSEVGWINDPNGFVYFQGEYHLFYQFYPYGSFWGPMHWGHAKTKDFLTWEHLPVALAPDMPYDKDGCFSGSAIVKDGQLWLMYTGNIIEEDGTTRQIQNMAVSSDGIHFEKIAQNPVLDSKDLPSNILPSDFRDPKLFERDGRYYSVLVGKTDAKTGSVLLYGSDDLVNWQFESVFLEGTAEQGFMWECPDYFQLDGQDFLVLSPMRYPASGNDFRNINSTTVFTGRVDWESKTFQVDEVKELDHGQDFYATQSLEDEDGRRWVIAWMQTWGRNIPTHELKHGWACCMTLPRELKLVDGKLKQFVPESVKAALPELEIDSLVKGGHLRLSLDQSLTLQLGSPEDHILFGYDAQAQEVFVSRENLTLSIQGEEEWSTARRAVSVKAETLDIYLDTQAIEIFVNDGEESLSSTFYLTGERHLTRL